MKNSLIHEINLTLTNPRRVLAIMALPFLIIADLLQNHIDYLDNESRPKLIADFKDMFYDFYYSKGELDDVKEEAKAKQEHKEKLANAYDIHTFNGSIAPLKMLIVNYGLPSDLPSKLLYDAHVIVHETEEGARLVKCQMISQSEASDEYRHYIKAKELKKTSAQKLADRL